MKTVARDIVVLIALAASGAALALAAYDGAPQTAGEDQPQPPTRETALGTEPPAPVPPDFVIDDEGMPLLIPVRAG